VKDAVPVPPDEEVRLEVLRRYGILDTPAEKAFDALARIAALICGTPISAVSLIDADRQWFKASVGLDITETPRDQAFCAHTILTPNETLVVADARRDPRFADNPFVTGDPGIRFYAGASTPARRWSPPRVRGWAACA
jgi:GAF domain-containing protein